MTSPRPFLALACWCALAFSAAAASVDLTTLATRSPFMPAAEAGVIGVAPEPVGTLEFRGVVVEPEGTFFSVFDATANRGYWLREGMSDGALRVTRYHSESGAIEIEQNGRAVTLELKQASTAISAKPVLTVSAPTAGHVRRTLRAQPSPEQIARMAQIAKEVRERRAQRLGSLAPQVNASATPASPGL